MVSVSLVIFWGYTYHLGDFFHGVLLLDLQLGLLLGLILAPVIVAADDPFDLS